MEVWAATVVRPQSGPMLKLPMRSASTSPLTAMTAIRMAASETSRETVITVLNLRRKDAP